MHTIHTVVVGVDFSDNSKDAIEAARELAHLPDGRLHLLHVVPDVFHTPWMVDSPGVDLHDVQRRWIEEAEQGLVVMAACEALDPIEVTTAVTVGSPAAAIVDYANEHHADSIVLGSHGHGLIRRFVLGSVAERVVRQTDCPVLVVPHGALRHASAA
jgi:nucleotide-binding universal stress UspA family protein